MIYPDLYTELMYQAPYDWVLAWKRPKSFWVDAWNK